MKISPDTYLLLQIQIRPQVVQSSGSMGVLYKGEHHTVTFVCKDIIDSILKENGASVETDEC